MSIATLLLCCLILLQLNNIQTSFNSHKVRPRDTHQDHNYNLTQDYFNQVLFHRLKQFPHGLHKKGHVSRVLIITILLCGDVHPNPGPVTYPCIVCSSPVANNHHALCCDSCDKWVHIRCAGISEREYNR